jgi:hypothetical protein
MICQQQAKLFWNFFGNLYLSTFHTLRSSRPFWEKLWSNGREIFWAVSRSWSKKLRTRFHSTCSAQGKGKKRYRSRKCIALNSPRVSQSIGGFRLKVSERVRASQPPPVFRNIGSVLERRKLNVLSNHFPKFYAGTGCVTFSLVSNKFHTMNYSTGVGYR